VVVLVVTMVVEVELVDILLQILLCNLKQHTMSQLVVEVLVLHRLHDMVEMELIQCFPQ
jgi:hypothetical protein